MICYPSFLSVTFVDFKTQKIRKEEAFKFEVNEISWNVENDLFFLTNGQGCVHVHNYPDMELMTTLQVRSKVKCKWTIASPSSSPGPSRQLYLHRV